MDHDDETSLARLRLAVDQARLESQQQSLDSQKKMERNTFWTMIAVAAHTGIGAIALAPDPTSAALAFPILAVAFLWW